MSTEKLAALQYHSKSPKGKIETVISKPLDSQEDLVLAYSPGVAYPCLEIHNNEMDSYTYTSRSNLVGIISFILIASRTYYKVTILILYHTHFKALLCSV